MKRQGLTRRSVLFGTVAAAAVPAPTSVLASVPMVHEVEIKSFKFEPAILQVRVGDTIRWTNNDVAPHTATAKDFSWDTGELEHSGSGEVVVTASMESSYFCVFHPHMKGKIKIIR